MIYVVSAKEAVKLSFFVTLLRIEIRSEGCVMVPRRGLDFSCQPADL